MSLTKIEGGVCAAKGFKSSGLHCGLRRNPHKKDIALIYCGTACNAAAAYTQNKLKAAPLEITHRHLQNPKANAIICNSAIANTFTPTCMEDALEMCKIAASELGIQTEQVLVASTGVIGEPMKLQPVRDNIGQLVSTLRENGSHDSANAIMTTDNLVKETAFSFKVGGKTASIGVIGKGSRMIHPNMATLLGFITTDLSIEQPLMQKALTEIVNDTLNMISIDGDTSTNDMLIVLANGLAGNDIINDENSQDYKEFYSALYEICLYLAKAIIEDGEGTTKFLECTVTGAKDLKNARLLAKSVITSNLFKSAMSECDATWGRIVCAFGYSGADFSFDGITLTYTSENGSITVCENGVGVAYNEENAKEILSANRINIYISINDGVAKATAWGCDMPLEYSRTR